MFRHLYSLIIFLCLPIIVLKLWLRGVKAQEYKERRGQRFAFFDAPKLNRPIWVHAVSVGELLAAEPIILQLKERFPERDIVVTTMTPTASQRIRNKLGDSVFHIYAPYDFAFAVRRFYKKIKPELLVIMETELWPNTIHYANENKCPVVVVNARLSERSARGYMRLRPAIQKLLAGISMVLAQYQNDAERFARLDIDESNIHVTGSVKYDIDIDPDIIERGRELKNSLSPAKKIWIAASTHEGEDELLFDIHRELKQDFSELLLLIAPRHPERFQDVYALALKKDFVCHRRTEHKNMSNEEDVFLIDTMGELMDFFVTADIAFIGGSLVEVGGHNPIEPAALSKPIVMGEYTFNFEAICQRLQEQEGLKIAISPGDLQKDIRKLLEDDVERTEMGKRACAVVDENRGAVDKVIAHLTTLIEAQVR